MSRRYKKRQKPCANEVDKIFVDYLKERTKGYSTDDYRKLFLLSLLPDVQKLSDGGMREFKMKVLNVLDELLTRPQQEHVTQT